MSAKYQEAEQSLQTKVHVIADDFVLLSLTFLLLVVESRTLSVQVLQEKEPVPVLICDTLE